MGFIATLRPRNRYPDFQGTFLQDDMGSELGEW